MKSLSKGDAEDGPSYSPPHPHGSEEKIDAQEPPAKKGKTTQNRPSKPSFFVPSLILQPSLPIFPPFTFGPYSQLQESGTKTMMKKQKRDQINPMTDMQVPIVTPPPNLFHSPYWQTQIPVVSRPYSEIIGHSVGSGPVGPYSMALTVPYQPRKRNLDDAKNKITHSRRLLANQEKIPPDPNSSLLNGNKTSLPSKDTPSLNHDDDDLTVHEVSATSDLSNSEAYLLLGFSLSCHMDHNCKGNVK